MELTPWLPREANVMCSELKVKTYMYPECCCVLNPSVHSNENARM